MTTTWMPIPTDENPECQADPMTTNERLSRLIRAARDMDAGRNCAEHEPVEADDPSR